MKSLTSGLSQIASFIFFPLLLIIGKGKKVIYLFGLLIITSLSSCFLNFYRTNTRSSIDSGTAAQLRSQKKYFVIHFVNSTNGLESVIVKNDSLYGSIVPLPPEHSKHLHPDAATKNNRIKKSDKKNTLIEVHLYTGTNLKNSDSVFAASVSSFNRIDVYELNKSSTNANHIISVAGVVAGSLLVIGTIGAAIACNCPQVYVENNGMYNFTSGLYSGAVYSTLERTDYLPLDAIPFDAKNIAFKITNTNNEEQFINKVELLQVDHQPGVYVLPDRHGNIFTYEKAMAPLTALINGKKDIKKQLAKTDEQYYSFDNNVNDNGFSDVRLLFDKPKDANKAKLIIHARNTYWGGFVHKEFLNLFGDGFEKWRTKQEKADPKDLEQWQTDQALPLMVYIKTNEGWKFVDYYQLTGTSASRDMIMQFDTKGIAGDKVELKLETTYRFWHLDFAGIDYSNNQNFTTSLVAPGQVIKSDSIDESATLQNSDKQYVHLVNDEFVSFNYSIPQASNNTEASYFLISRGYYHNLEHITGKTNYNELLKFKQRGAFDKFSREKYTEVQDLAAVLKDQHKN